MISMTQIAVIRIRGGSRIHCDIKETLDKLNLRNQHQMIIVENTSSTLGMLKKAKDYITWGEVSPEVVKSAEPRKKGNIYCLHPPRGGFERKGIKAPFSTGGVLGNRGDAINQLITKML